jgi:transketolase
MNGARYAYLQRICEMVEAGRDIIIISEDYAAPVFDEFRKQYPQRFLSVGIAEQNGVAVACGLALAGKYPIVYGCAPFPLTRALDQVKSAVAGMHLPMTILNSGIGFGVPEFGATHYNADDIALVRGIPGIRMITPSDTIMGEAIAEYSLESKSPIYLRFDKYSEGVLPGQEQIDFEKGFRTVLESGINADLVIISCGAMLQEMSAAVVQIQSHGIVVKLIDLYSLPFDIPALMDEVRDAPIVTVEEHIVQGGIGSVVLETLHDYGKKNAVKRVGIRFKEGYPSTSGSRGYYLRNYGLTTKDIMAAVESVLHSSWD